MYGVVLLGMNNYRTNSMILCKKSDFFYFGIKKQAKKREN
jgi:hypothetical protein